MITLLLSLILSAAPQSKPPHAPAPKRDANRVQPQGHKPYLHSMGKSNARYYVQHGHRFKYGYWYSGYVHPHWSYHVWDSRYGCFLYYDPGVKVYYYWNPVHYRYYPVSYVPDGCRYDYDFQETPKQPDTPPPAPPPYEGK